ncbi:MAG: CcmD family protein [Firmicutes bacterium]|nr:CcmD family protein [Bacillota bacterium]
MSYLFAAFAAVWVGVFLYTLFLTGRVRRLEEELQTLRVVLDNPDAERPSQE